MIGWIVPPYIPSKPYPPRCIMCTDPENDTALCQQPTNGKTILDRAICDDCYADIGGAL